MKKPTMQEFHEILEKVSRILLAQIETLIAPKEVLVLLNGKEVMIKDCRWKVAHYERRQKGEKAGKRHVVERCTVVFANGGLRGSRLPLDGFELCDDLWQMRSKLFEKKWYGLGISTYPDGKWEAVYNYDPKCFDGDPDFFKLTDKPPAGEKANLRAAE